MSFFNNFPVIPYDITGKQLTNYQTATNIFFRLAVIREVLSGSSTYYEYVIKDGETPEIIAENVYKDAEAHWVVLLANNIIDVHYDWPLDSRSFRKYIIGKYGSIQNAQTTYHHYEKVIQREESASGLITETRFEINQNEIASSLDPAIDALPYDTYASLPETQLVETINMGGGKTVIQTTFRNRVTNYDWELEQNEAKRFIKIIKPEYYPQIAAEFQKFTNYSTVPYRRNLIG